MKANRMTAAHRIILGATAAGVAFWFWAWLECAALWPCLVAALVGAVIVVKVAPDGRR